MVGLPFLTRFWPDSDVVRSHFSAEQVCSRVVAAAIAQTETLRARAGEVALRLVAHVVHDSVTPIDKSTLFDPTCPQLSRRKPSITLSYTSPYYTSKLYSNRGKGGIVRYYFADSIDSTDERFLKASSRSA